MDGTLIFFTEIDDETSIDLVLNREPFPLRRQLDTQHYGHRLWNVKKACVSRNVMLSQASWYAITHNQIRCPW
jgi:hypothetical protein